MKRHLSAWASLGVENGMGHRGTMEAGNTAGCHLLPADQREGCEENGSGGVTACTTSECTQSFSCHPRTMSKGREPQSPGASGLALLVL